MKTQTSDLSDEELDRALDVLLPPAPSEPLLQRVRAMAPTPARLPVSRRYAAAAALAVTVAAAAVLYTATAPVAPDRDTGAATAVLAETPPEFAVDDIALVDTPAGPDPAALFSMASMPLE